MASLRMRLRRWLEVPDFPWKTFGNITVTGPALGSNPTQPTRVTVTGPTGRNELVVASGKLHAASFHQDGSVDLHIVADEITMERA